MADTTPRPVTDLSARAISLAREIDRLPPGAVYVVTIEKPTLKALDWMVDISKSERIRAMVVGRKVE